MATTTDQVAAQAMALRGVAMRLCRGNPDRADDLMQETYLRASVNLDKFDGRNLGGWMRVIMRNIFFNEQNKKREYEDPEDTFISTLGMAPAQHTTLELKQTLANMARLPEHWQRYIWFGASGEDLRATAKRLGVPEGSLKSGLFRGRRELRRIMDGNE